MSEPYWVPLSGGPIYLPNPAARVYRTTNQSIPSGTATAVSFDAERFDTDGIHDPAVNPTRLTCRTAGKYLIFASLAWNAAVTGGQTLIRLNGGNYLTGDYVIGAIDHRATQLATVYDLAIGDYVELVLFHATGSAVDVLVAGNYSPEFGMARLDAALPTTLPPVAGGELAYAENPANTLVTTSTEATATVVVTAPPITVDGATPILIDFFANSVYVPTGASITLTLWDGSTCLGSLLVGSVASQYLPSAAASRRLTPSAGTHTYSVRVHGSGSGGQVTAGPGGAALNVPAFIRITRA